MNILLLGNGFDLAHGLPTKYTDFLEFIDVVLQIVDRELDIDHINWKEINEKVKNLVTHNTRNIPDNLFTQKEMWDDLASENFWFEYFTHCKMHSKENWIDFESEIGKVIQALDTDMFDESGKKYQLSDDIGDLSNEFLRDMYSKYTFTSQSVNVLIDDKNEYITFKEIRDKLHTDLIKLIRALELYLDWYVKEMEISILSEDIKGLSIDKVLSFNYTDTYEKLYGEEQSIEYDYIHGKADASRAIESNNMVLGIDEYLLDDRKNKDVEFIAFKKFYQRIHKETGSKYKEWVDEIEEEWENVNTSAENFAIASGQLRRDPSYFCDFHNLYIFGHSLDATDGDVLRDLILNDNVYTTIYYYNKEVYGQQIANLVKVIGQEELIKRTGGGTKTIEFKQQQPMIEIKD